MVASTDACGGQRSVIAFHPVPLYPMCMLYIFHGTDGGKVADRTNETLRALRAKRPDAQVYVFEGELFDIARVDELIDARGLFVERHVVVLKGVCETSEGRDRVFPRLERFSRSENVFVISEGSLHPSHKKTLAAHAHKVEDHERPTQKKRVFDEFGMVAALKERNKRALWERYLRARMAHESPEASCGMLHWAVRDMLLHEERYVKHYSREELRALSRSLIEVYHEAHRGTYDLDTALERWVLTM